MAEPDRKALETAKEAMRQASNDNLVQGKFAPKRLDVFEVGLAAYLAALPAQSNRATEALQAQEDAENSRDKCPDCEGEGEWWQCGRCSERYGTAIELRREVLSLATKEPSNG